MRAIGLLLCGACLLLLTTCTPGAGSGSSPGANSPPPSPQPTTPSSASSCPNPTAMPGFARPAKVVLTLAEANRPHTIADGQILEIRLPDTMSWSLVSFTPGPLQLEQPAGFTDLATHTCVWRFQAVARGTTTLSYNGRPICKPGQMCPMFIMAARFPITVQ